MSTARATAELKVKNLVSSYRSLRSYVPLLSEMLQPLEFRRLFWLSLKHDLFVLRQRSQDLADNEITITQRAFITLSEGGQYRVPSANIYMLEILGLGFIPNAETINNAIQTRVSVLQHINGPRTSNAVAMGRQSQAFLKPQPRSESLFVSECSEDSFEEQPSETASMVKEAYEGSGASVNEPSSDDPKLKRLFVMYHEAKKDFDTTAETRVDRTNAAKFLRDTIENCLEYIASKQYPMSIQRLVFSSSEVPHNSEWLVELRNTLAETTAVAEQGLGGKKRRFDEDWHSVPQKALKMKPTTEGTGPNSIATKTSVYSAPMPTRQAFEQSTGSFPVTRYHPALTQQAINAPREQRAPRKVRFAPYVVNYHQHRAETSERRRSISPRQFHVHHAEQSLHHKRGGSTDIRERRPFRGVADTYRPSYR